MRAPTVGKRPLIGKYSNHDRDRAGQPGEAAPPSTGSGAAVIAETDVRGPHPRARGARRVARSDLRTRRGPGADGRGRRSDGGPGTPVDAEHLFSLGSQVQRVGVRRRRRVDDRVRRRTPQAASVGGPHRVQPSSAQRVDPDDRRPHRHRDRRRASVRRRRLRSGGDVCGRPGPGARDRRTVPLR